MTDTIIIYSVVIAVSLFVSLAITAAIRLN